jgi:hypothetical protein
MGKARCPRNERITLRRGDPFCSSGLLPTLAALRIGKRQGERIDFAPIACSFPVVAKLILCCRELLPCSVAQGIVAQAIEVIDVFETNFRGKPPNRRSSLFFSPLAGALRRIEAFSAPSL